MKNFIRSLEKAGFTPELVPVCYGEYYDGTETKHGYTCEVVFIEIGLQGYGARLETLCKICKRYNMESRYYTNYGFYGHNKTVYEIMKHDDYYKSREAIAIQNRAEVAFWTALHNGKTQEEAIKAMCAAV